MGRRGPPLAVRLPAVPRNGAHRCVVPPQLRRLGRARHPRDRRHGTVCRRRDDQAWYRGGPRCVLATGPRALGGDGAVAELLRRAHAIGAGVHRRLEGHVGRRAVRALRRRARRARRRPQPPVPTTARPARPEGRHRPRERGDLVRVPRPGRLACADSARTRLGARARTSGDDDRLADDEPARIALLAEARLPPDLPAPASLRRMTRVPLLAGSRIAIVTTGDDDVVLAPPPPREPIADVAAAVRDALRFPLAGEPLEPPNLPVPSTPLDPRPAALEATVDALERAGIVSERLTILVAGGLARRAGRAELELLVPPPLTRRFRGAVEVHDAASPELVAVPAESRREIRVHRALVDTDLVVTISAAETVLHGGPGLLVGAADAETIRAAGAYSLLETTASQGWQIAVAIERALARRAPVIGASLVLTLPRLTGVLQGYPYDSESLDRVVRSPLRHLFSLLPGAIRERALRTVPASRGASAAFAGPPSVAHAEALLRGTEERARVLGAPLDAICLGVPATTPHLPRERPNPLLAAYLGLGLALRLWRDAFPVVDGGTAILLHPFDRRFAHPTQQPYREFFRAMRGGTARDLGLLREAEAAAADNAKLLDAYRAGRTHHPLQPYAEWEACGPALGRLGTVLVAGCRDHDAARSLGFVPM